MIYQNYFEIIPEKCKGYAKKDDTEGAEIMSSNALCSEAMPIQSQHQSQLTAEIKLSLTQASSCAPVHLFTHTPL